MQRRSLEPSVAAIAPSAPHSQCNFESGFCALWPVIDTYSLPGLSFITEMPLFRPTLTRHLYRTWPRCEGGPIRLQKRFATCLGTSPFHRATRAEVACCHRTQTYLL